MAYSVAWPSTAPSAIVGPSTAVTLTDPAASEADSTRTRAVPAAGVVRSSVSSTSRGWSEVPTMANVRAAPAVTSKERESSGALPSAAEAIRTVAV